MRFLLNFIFITTFPLLATAGETVLACKEEVSLQEFVADRETGCFVESFQEGVLMYIMAPLNVGDKALSIEPGGNKIPSVAEDFQKNGMIGFYNQQGEDSAQGMHWPYAEPSRVRNGSVTFGNPFRATVKVTTISAGQKRVLITKENKSVSFLCKEDCDKQCNHPAIVNTDAPKVVPTDSVNSPAARGSQTTQQ